MHVNGVKQMILSICQKSGPRARMVWPSAVAAALLSVFLFVNPLTLCATEGEPCAAASVQDVDSSYVMLSTDGESWTPLENLSGFVDSQIRTKFGVTSTDISIYLSLRVEDAEKVRVTLTMDSQNFYVTAINGQTLPSEIETYNNRLALNISKDAIVAIITETGAYNFSEALPAYDSRTYNDVVSIYNKQRIAKMYAFLFGESARFETVEHALDKVLDDSQWVEWHDFDALLHNWSNISAFLINSGKKEDWQLLGGASGKLVAPITEAQVIAFVSALEAGENYKFSRSAPFTEVEFYRNTSPAVPVPVTSDAE